MLAGISILDRSVSKDPSLPLLSYFDYIMAFSCACAEFIHLSIFSFEEHNVQRHEEKDGYSVKRACFLDERLRISKSADNCQLCENIYHFLKDGFKDHYYQPTTEDEWIIDTSVRYSCLDGYKGHISLIELSCRRKEWESVGGVLQRLELTLHAWADKGVRL